MKPRAILYHAAPPLLLLALYWRGLFAWFQKDDFAWLGLRDLVHSERSIWWALFAPLAQGTIRTLPERAVFLSFVSLFGLHAPPFRLLAFFTAAAAAAMLCAVATKISGSRAVGFWSAILWIANCALGIPMAWTAVYYEIAWPLCVLCTFWCLLRYEETGERRFFLAQIALFIAGFFVLELNVVYPALALTYAMARGKRRLMLQVLPLFALSLVYAMVHFAVAPLPASGPYQMFWDARIFTTLTVYWGWALSPGEGRLVGVVSTLYRSASVWLLTAGLLAFALRKRRRIVAWFPAWFLIVLSPLLPLRNHIDPEYLVAPVLGLAMWGAWALVSAWRANAPGKIAAAIALGIYAGFSIPIGQAHLRSFYERSQRIRTFVLEIADAARANPGKMILLKGVSSEQFNDVIYDRALRLYTSAEIYIVAENRASIDIAPQIANAADYFADPAVATAALRDRRAILLDFSTSRP